MKIISVPDQDYKLKCTCMACGTVVECELHDFKLFLDQRDGDCCAWECPTCTKTNYVDLSFIPYVHRHKIPR